MLLIWARAIIQVYMAVNKIKPLAQSMSFPSMIDGAVPISTSGNKATSGWRLHHHHQQQQTQAFEKDGERRARWSYAPLHFVCDEHSPSRCLFLSDGGDNNSNIVSFDFRVTTLGKNLEHAQNSKSNSQSNSPYTSTFSATINQVISGS